MILLLIEGTQALSINNNDRELLPIFLCIEHLFPYPQALGTWINSWAYLKALEYLGFDFTIGLFS